MKICRFNDARLGLVEGEEVLDVTAALDVIPAQRYPLPNHDLMIEHLGPVMARIDALRPGAAGKPSMFIGDWGLFLKASSAVIGFGEEVKLRKGDRRDDHEIELAVVIGKRVERATAATALDCVAGYAIGLDMTVRGPENRSWRKSIDTYAPLGPWLVTRDEIPDLTSHDLSIRVNGELRQQLNTRMLVFSI